jgi:hypothetical protein
MAILHHFYHVGADGDWEPAAAAHVAAIRAAGLDCPVTIGVTGYPANTARAATRMAGMWPEAEIACADGPGFEQPTLTLARGWARAHRRAMILYAHTKGASSGGWFNTAWRESMTADVVGRWAYCLDILAGGCDVVAPHWLDPDCFPGMAHATQRNGGSLTPYPGGNFWWARAAYLATLPVPDPDGTPWDAERWVGLGRPHAYDLRPGWPGVMIFDSPTARQVISEGAAG